MNEPSQPPPVTLEVRHDPIPTSQADSQQRKVVYDKQLEFRKIALSTWLALGSMAHEVHLYQLAIDSFDFALQNDPFNEKALCGLAAALRAMDLVKDQTDGTAAALDVINDLLSRSSELYKDPSIWREAAECYLLLNNTTNAMEALQRCIQLTPNNSALWLLKGQTLMAAGSKHEAVDALNTALVKLPNDVADYTKEEIDVARSTHSEFASVLAAEGNIEAARDELEATLALPPPSSSRFTEYSSLWCALISANERLGDMAKAVRVCEEASGLLGFEPCIYICHAYLLLLPNSHVFNPQSACVLLRQVVNSESNDFLPWFLLGEAYQMLRQPSEAYEAFQLALKRAPNHTIVWLAVGNLYAELGQLADALSAYMFVIKRETEQEQESKILLSFAWEGLSSVYEKCHGQLADSIEACMKSSSYASQAGDSSRANFLNSRLETLRRVVSGEIPLSDYRPSTCCQSPLYLLRDLTSLSISERENLANASLDDIASSPEIKSNSKKRTDTSRPMPPYPSHSANNYNLPSEDSQPQRQNLPVHSLPNVPLAQQQRVHVPANKNLSPSADQRFSIATHPPAAPPQISPRPASPQLQQQQQQQQQQQFQPQNYQHYAPSPMYPPSQQSPFPEHQKSLTSFNQMPPIPPPPPPPQHQQHPQQMHIVQQQHEQQHHQQQHLHPQHLMPLPPLHQGPPIPKIESPSYRNQQSFMVGVPYSGVGPDGRPIYEPSQFYGSHPPARFVVNE
ncbi:hypothetical protein LJB42_000319 [Komagataella kurtzmanii]|nr:hypothetical protein LJB42_000319 [Komagataella kurtzmanii]